MKKFKNQKRNYFNNFLKLTLIFVCCYLFFLTFELESCTRVFWNDNTQAKIVARTMDLFISDEPQIWINPQGIFRESKVDANGLKWTSLYGSVSISAFHIENLITDGLNEKGLAVHVLALGSTQYEKRNDRPGIHYGEWLQYILDTCQTVEEALYAHNTFQVVPIAINGFVWPLHLTIEDAKGDSAIIEFVEGKMQIYHSSDYQIATNDPTYDKHLINLSNYKKLGATLSLDQEDSVSRFLRSFTCLKQLPEPKSSEEAVELLKNMMTSVFQKDHASKNIGINYMSSELRVSTLWTAISDLTNRIYYFFLTNKSEGIRIDLRELNFSEKAPTEIGPILENL